MNFIPIFSILHSRHTITTNVLLLGDVAGLKFLVFTVFRRKLQVQNRFYFKTKTAILLSSCYMMAFYASVILFQFFTAIYKIISYFWYSL